MQMMMAVGTVMTVIGKIQEGNSAQKAATYEAAQMNYNAGQERASSQRSAEEQRRQKDYAESRFRAVAASSGGGAADPTIVKGMGNLEQEGEYRANTALFQGEEKARGLETGAALKMYEGQVAKQQSRFAAIGSAMSGASSFYDQYWPKKTSTASYSGGYRYG